MQDGRHADHPDHPGGSAAAGYPAGGHADAPGSELGPTLTRHDWSGFSLGAPDRWPGGVREAVRWCLGSRLPSMVLCGPELELIHNDEYRTLLGEPASGTFGRPFRECWPRLWPEIGDSLDAAMRRGEPVHRAELRVRRAQDEAGELWVGLSAGPVREPDGRITGLLCVLSDTTRRVIGERRLATLTALRRHTGAGGAGSTRLCETAAEVCAKNPEDLPFGTLYLLEGEQYARQAGAWGAVPDDLRLGELVELSAAHWPLARAVRDREVVTGGDGRHRVYVLPLAPSAAHAPLALLVCGQRPDERHREFVELLAQQLGSALAEGRARERAPLAGRTEVPDSAGLPGHGDDTRGARVLVADDDAPTREDLQRVLSPYWTVQAVPDGHAALAAIHKYPPELVLADATMPGLNGMELLSALRGDEETAALPVILLSASPAEESVVEGLRAGADDYVTKPFIDAELVARVRTHLSTVRLRQRLTQRLRELADASHALTTSLNTDEICNVVADLVVPERARWCVIWLVHEDEEHHTRVTGHYAVPDSDSEQARRLRAAVREHGELAVRLLGAGDVLFAGRAPAEPVQWPAELTPLRGQETITRPMMARRRLVGAITFGAPRLPERDSADGAYLRELARRAALAFDNAALYEAQQRIALGLQRSLLPASLPSVSGLRLAARYLPGSRGTRVGGDWYDAVALTDGRFVLSVGDVVGQGVTAAASMGQLRTALRSYALENERPVDVLARVDTFLRQAGGATFATCLYGSYDPARASLRLANAGHLSPWLLVPGRPPETLPIGTGVPLGGASALVDRPDPFASHEVWLPPGGTLLLHTDGLVEAHRGDLDEGLAMLRDALDRGFASPDELCEHVLDVMAVDENGTDDVTLLALMRPDDAVEPATSAPVT